MVDRQGFVPARHGCSITSLHSAPAEYYDVGTRGDGRWPSRDRPPVVSRTSSRDTSRRRSASPPICCGRWRWRSTSRRPSSPIGCATRSASCGCSTTSRSAGAGTASPTVLTDPHTDYGLITLLATDGVAGLEVRAARRRMDDGRGAGAEPDRQPRRHARPLDQRPLRVHPAPRIGAARQRPLLGAVLRQPRPGDDVSCLPACVTAERPCRYEPVTAERVPRPAHRRRRLHADDSVGRRVPVSAPADHRLALLRGLYGDAAESIEARATARSPTEPRPADARSDPGRRLADRLRRQLPQPGVAPLVTLRDVIDRHLAPEINGVHVLPFHPASSDRGLQRRRLRRRRSGVRHLGRRRRRSPPAAGSWPTPCSTTCRPRATGSGRSSPASRRTTASSARSTRAPT